MDLKQQQILTSYFASRAPAERKVCIAKHNRFFKGLRAPKLAPSDPKAVEWQQAYLKDLAQRFTNPEFLAHYLLEACRQVPNPILCCYEKNPQECHRSVLAEYIHQQLGIEVKEWTPAS